MDKCGTGTTASWTGCLHNELWDTTTPWTVLRDEVRKRFQWLIQQQDAHTPEGTCEIAGLFVPWSQPVNGPANGPTGGTMFFSSVPRGPWSEKIRNDLLEGTPPSWWAEPTTILARTQTSEFHATEGTYHLLQMETTQSPRFSGIQSSSRPGGVL